MILLCCVIWSGDYHMSISNTTVYRDILMGANFFAESPHGPSEDVLRGFNFVSSSSSRAAHLAACDHAHVFCFCGKLIYP